MIKTASEIRTGGPGALWDEAEANRTTTITRRGVPVAQVVPIRQRITLQGSDTRPIVSVYLGSLGDLKRLHFLAGVFKAFRVGSTLDGESDSEKLTVHVCESGAWSGSLSRQQLGIEMSAGHFPWISSAMLSGIRAKENLWIVLEGFAPSAAIEICIEV